MQKIECISVFDMLKVGVGPSSSHTLGPWRAAQRWLEELKHKNIFDEVVSIHIDLYGSLSLTGKGHATDIAVMLGLCGFDPVNMDLQLIEPEIQKIRNTKTISLKGEKTIAFDAKVQIKFIRKFLEFHPNGMIFRAELKNGKKTFPPFIQLVEVLW